MKKRRTELLTIILGLFGLIGWVSIASAQGGPNRAESRRIVAPSSPFAITTNRL